LEQQARDLHVADRVHFMGFRADVADLTQLYDVAVLPSLSEALGYVLLEAMALRKPVVASRIDGIPEVVEDGVTGTLGPCKDPKALAEAIIDLLKNPGKARAFGDAGRRRVEEKFTQKRMMDETFALFDELLRRKNGRKERTWRGKGS
jgi:glycosyltransferase involved in cell wall biosynthesis